MLINAEERIAYWGHRHMNISCRDINDDEEPDLIGLERILYSVDFLAVTETVGIKPYDGISEASQLSSPDSQEGYSEQDDYEESAISHPDYEPAESSIGPSYPSLEDGADPFAAISGSEDADLGEIEIEDLGELGSLGNGESAGKGEIPAAKKKQANDGAGSKGKDAEKGNVQEQKPGQNFPLAKLDELKNAQ